MSNNVRKYVVYGTVVAALAGVLVALFAGKSWWGKWLYPVQYESLVWRYAGIHGVDAHVVFAIIRVESNFVPSKTSPKGARGLMQMMPATEQWIRKQNSNLPRANMYDPETNIAFGTWYMRALMRQFVHERVTTIDGLARLAVAYNAGPGKAEQWLTMGVWDGTFRGIRTIPYGETRHYVERVWYYYQKYVEHIPDRVH
jgi:soluble lytic murein transglycosylase